MFRPLILAALLWACEPTKTTPDTATTDTGEPISPPPTYDVHDIALTAAHGWAGGAVPYAGYAGAGAPDGIYLADPFGDGTQALIYRIPWTVEGASLVESAADRTLTTGLRGPDKIGYDQGHLSIPDAAADVGDVLAAGIGYSFATPPESGDISAQATVSIRGDVVDGYAARIIWLDADGDGAVDDVAATQGRDDTDTHMGVIGIFLDAAGVQDFGEADLVLDACYRQDGTRISYGAVDLALDSDGYLWASCPATNYHSGSAEAWPLPIDGGSPSYAVINVGGWTVSPDPSGGVWLGAQGNGYLAYASAMSETVEAFTAPDAAESYFGAAPFALQTEGGQTLILVGMQTRSTDDAAEATSAAYLCDITDGRTLDEDHCARIDPVEAVPCIGAVQGLEEIDGVVYGFTAGWVYGSGTGCGVVIARLDPGAE